MNYDYERPSFVRVWRDGDTHNSICAPETVRDATVKHIKTQLKSIYAYSKKIMGYELLDNLSAEGPLKALESDLIHHSDRGLQYCSAGYINILKENNVKISMTENGDPYENAIAERINGILKYEFLIIDGFKNHVEALEVIKESVGIYNNERPHLSCKMLTPNQTHLQQEIQIKKWKKKTSKVFTSEV